jgi:hypothetical protein
MKLVLLEINDRLRNFIKPDSFINNFSDIDLIYFSIPPNLTIADQNRLINQGFIFFQSQFSVNIENHIYVENEKDFTNKIEIAKEISWEIFYRFNKWVKVSDGIFDEDLDWFISGFTGKIIDFYANDETSVFLIAFSGDALSKIPLEHLKTNFNNISPFYTYLESGLIMPDKGPENINIDEKQRIEIMLKLINFPDYSTGEKFKCLSDLLQFWEDQFISKLVNPIEVRINSSNQSIYQLIDIPYFDERFGVWVTLFSGEKIIDVPIMEIDKVFYNITFNELIIEYKKMMAFLLPN